MKTPTCQTYLTDLSALDLLARAARSLRNRALRQHVVEPMLRLCGSLLRLPTISGERLLPR
jgi:hypothetical protein